MDILNAVPQESFPALHFHLFPQLPTELRLKIWNHAISQRSILAFSPRTEESRKKKLRGLPYPIANNSGIACACKEARDIVSSTHRRIELPSNSGICTTWVDFSTTFIFLGDSKLQQDISELPLAKYQTEIRHLVLRRTHPYGKNSPQICERALSLFKNLDSISILCGPRNANTITDLPFLELFVEEGEKETEFWHYYLGYEDINLKVRLKIWEEKGMRIPDVRLVWQDPEFRNLEADGN